MIRYYNKDKQEVLNSFNIGYNGLSKKQVEENRKLYGKNELLEKDSKSKARVFLEQFQDILVIILIIAALISLFTNELESTIVIFSVIVLNAFLGTYQHFKAEKSLKSLKELSSPVARVIRNGAEETIHTSEIVIGDIVVIKAGDIISCDGRIIYSKSLEVNESSLTGESQSVDKTDAIIKDDDVLIADQKNMVFSGSLVTAGKALYVTTATGMNSELGKIADMLYTSKNHRTPLQVSLDEFSKKLAILIIVICVIVFGLSIYRNVTLLDSLLFAVALAVAAIPEALSSIVTIVLAIGTQRMASENAIIKELKAVEGLGCINVICSDKTGTLTQNKMEVINAYTDNYVNSVSRFDVRKKVNNFLLMGCYLCNDSVLTSDQNKNATELALIEFSKKLGISIYKENEKKPRLSEVPFDSNRKIMSTLNYVNGKYYIFTKGAPDVVLSKCSYIYTKDKVRRITTGDHYDINVNTRSMANQGFRTIAVAYKEFDKDVSIEKQITYQDEKNLVFVGFLSLYDPPRKESKLAIKEAISAGIKPVMITGDHKNTAISIGKDVGIFKDGDICLTGAELDKTSDQELVEVIDKTSIYARVSPEHKLRIVKSWQAKKGVVAFVGDGINDAPAIKQANIGISMGRSGTEVSKEASSIILTDDNYYTIIKAVKNGRKVYNNIQNAITFLLSGNAAGILLVIYTSLLALPIPFAPVHLLFINLLTDSLPAIAIGMEDSDEDVLSRKPRKLDQSLLSKRVIQIIMFEGVLIGFFTILSYYMGLRKDIYVARTAVFATLCIARLFHSLNCRGTKSIFRNKVKNKAMIGSILLGLILINLVLFIPFLQNIFQTKDLDNKEILYIYLFSIMPTMIIQTILLLRHRKKN